MGKLDQLEKDLEQVKGRLLQARVDMAEALMAEAEDDECIGEGCDDEEDEMGDEEDDEEEEEE